MKVKYPEIGFCGLSCRICPGFHVQGKSRCSGCKTKFRMFGPCTMLHCKIRREQGIEFCWDCKESKTCPKWKKHRKFSKKYDTFKCYQTLEKDIAFIKKHGVKEFEKTQKQREKLLKELLKNFNEGRSKNFYCIAVTILEIDGIKKALTKGKKESENIKDIKEKAKLMHKILDEVAQKDKKILKLRK